MSSLTAFWLGFLYMHKKQCASLYDASFLSKKKLAVSRGNVFHMEGSDHDTLIFEIREPDEIKNASFRGFLYPDEKMIGKLSWNNGETWELQGIVRLRESKKLVVSGRASIGRITEEFWLEFYLNA